MRTRTIDSTSNSELFFIIDSSTGEAKTGLTSASPGAAATYTRLDSATSTTITTSDLTAQTDAFSSGGMIETSATGVYRLDVPNAAYAAGVDSVVVSLSFDGALTERLLIGLNDIATSISAIKATTDTLSLASIADSIWDEAIADHLSVGSAGELVETIGTLTVAERTAVADELLKRDLSAITGEAAFSLINAIRSLRFYDVSGGVLTVFKEDGITSAWVANTTQQAATPITAVLPQP